MKLSGKKENDIVILKVLENITSFDYIKMDKIVAQLKGVKKVIIDLSAVNQVTSQGMQCLSYLDEKVKKGGGILYICNLTPPVKNTFMFLQLGPSFPIVETIEDAKRKLRDV